MEKIQKLTIFRDLFKTMDNIYSHKYAIVDIMRSNFMFKGPVDHIQVINIIDLGYLTKMY